MYQETLITMSQNIEVAILCLTEAMKAKMQIKDLTILTEFRVEKILLLLSDALFLCNNYFKK